MRRRLIDADELIEFIENRYEITWDSSTYEGGIKDACVDFLEKIKEMIAQEGEQEDWIPFTYRTPTEEEKEDYPDWDYVLDCKLPEDGQRILVTFEHKEHKSVQMDEFYYDSEGCYLDSGYDVGTEVTARMPLPEPWKGEQDEQQD